MRAIALFIALVATTVSAQSNLPACQGSDFSRWSNCLGTRTWPNGDTYVGEYKDGKRNGQGTYTWPDSGRYVGEFRDNKLTGQGIFTATDGSPPQEGIWENNLFVRSQRILGHAAGGTPSTPTAVPAQSNLPACQGSDFSRWSNCYGTVTLPGGNKYVGEYRDGKRNGQGTFTWPNGEKYVGEFRDGKRHGQGTSMNPDGSKHFGEYRDDKRNGQGTYTFTNGQKYVGEFRDGVRYGQGTFTWPDGSKHVGVHRDDKRNGQGITTFADGRSSQEGIWEDDSFVRAQRIPDHIAGRTSTAAQAVAQVTPPLARGPSDSYGGRVAASIRPNLVLADPVVGDPRAEVEVRADAEGKILSRRLVTGSGNAAWDIAVLRAIDRTAFLPRDTDGRVPSVLIIGLRPEGAIPDAVGSIQNSEQIAGSTSPAKQAVVQVAPPKVQTAPPVAQAPRQAEPPRPTLTLSASASQPDANGVVALTISTNSDTASLRVNGDEVGGRADGRYSVQRFAQIGNNNFEVIATDRFGNTQRKTISVSRQAADNTVRFASLNPIAVRARPATNAVAIIIGIQDYRRVSKAEFANNDARVFYDYAVRGLGVRPENIKLLVDQEADQVEVLSAFKNWLPLKTRKGQTDVYVFYSGHGLPSDDGSNLYMLPHGVDRQFLNETAIKQSVLITALQAVSPRSVTMFMDACYSGQSRTGETLLASARPISIQSKASSYPANFNVISASAPDQLASSSPDLKHGMFSYFLMKGMEGEADENKDGNITMAEMQSYLKEYVGKKAMSLNRTQVPQLNGDQSKVLVGR